MLKKVSKVAKSIQNSAVASIISKKEIASWKDAIYLAGGEPKFPVLDGLIEKLIKYDESKLTKYPPFLGYTELRCLLREKLKKINNVKATLEEIIVVPGGSSALYASLFVTLNKGDEVLRAPST